jgi:hypothetical protein
MKLQEAGKVFLEEEGQLSFSYALRELFILLVGNPASREF